MNLSLQDLLDNRDIEIWYQLPTNGGWVLVETISPKREMYKAKHTYLFGLLSNYVEYEKSLETHLALRVRAYNICKTFKERTCMKTKKIESEYEDGNLGYGELETIWDSARGGWL